MEPSPYARRASIGRAGSPSATFPLRILSAMALADWELEWLMAAPEPPPTLDDLIPARPAWMARATCRGRSDVNFFPSNDEPGIAARGVCAGCPVREPCLAYAVAEDLEGVWAGTSKRERRAMRRRAS